MRLLLNGLPLAPGEPALSPLDEGLLYGYGLFETIRAVEGRMPLLERHLDRLLTSAGRLGLAVPRSREAIAADLAGLCADLPDARVRLTLTRGAAGHIEPVLLALAVPYQAPEGPWRAEVVAGHPGADSPTRGLKSLAYLPWLLAREQARSHGRDEALMTDAAGSVVEGAVSNVFAVLRDGTVQTPALSEGPLPGVARAWTLRMLDEWGIPFREGRLDRETVAGAAGMFVTNALMGPVPLQALGDRTFADHELARRLQRAFRDLFGAEPRR